MLEINRGGLVVLDIVGNTISPEEIASHPRFAEARTVYIAAMLRLHENNAALNRLLLNEARAFIFFTIITMHACYRVEDRQTWPTVEALKQTLEGFGIASSRRVHDFIRRLTDIGYVESLPVTGDRRMKVLTPTEAMLAHDRETLAVYFRPLHALFPIPGYLEPLQGDPEFQRVARQIGLQFTAHAQQFIQANPVIRFFLPRQGGMMVLTKLMDLRQDQGDDAMHEISFVSLGDSFGISRTQVRKLLLEAETLELVRLRGNALAMTPSCRAGFDRFLADTMAGNDLIYRLALRQMVEAG